MNKYRCALQRRIKSFDDSSETVPAPLHPPTIDLFYRQRQMNYYRGQIDERKCTVSPNDHRLRSNIETENIHRFVSLNSLEANDRLASSNDRRSVVRCTEGRFDPITEQNDAD